MELRRMFFRSAVLAVAALSLAANVLAQGSASSSSTSSSSSSAAAKHVNKPAVRIDPGLDPGAVANGIYRNKALALSCKIPAGWVLRTDEMNAPVEKTEDEKETPAQPTAPASSAGAKVLLAAFSRPPEARAEDVNASIVIAAESAASYPELKEAAQYFFPLTEVAKAQGFTPDEDPYEIALGTKTLVRGDFHKDRGTRVMHQSTLVMLSHGYAISITVIGGTDDEVEDLIDGLTFSAPGKEQDKQRPQSKR
jgi:hypothetical protein